MKEMSRDEEEMCKRFGPAGYFVVYGRYLKNGAKSVKAVGKSVGVSAAGVNKKITEIEGHFGLTLLTREHTGCSLTQVGLALLGRLEDALQRANVKLDLGQKPSRLIVEVETESMLAELVTRVVGSDYAHSAVPVEVVSHLDRTAIRKEANEARPPFNLAVVWNEGEASHESRPRKSGERDLSAEVPLLVAHRDREALHRFSAEVTLGVPLFCYSDCPMRFPKGWKIQAVSSFRQALVNAVGGLGYGIVPALYPTLDVYRSLGLLSYKALPELKSVRISAVIPDAGQGGRELVETLFASLARGIGDEIPNASHLDGTAPGNSIPIAAGEYHQRSFHGYFIGPSGESASWDAERVMFGDVKEVNQQTGGSEKVGAHSLFIQSGKFTGRSGQRFTFTGGVIENTLLYLTANKDVTATKRAFQREQRTPKEEDLRPISIQCLFPYSLVKTREKKSFRVFIGLWVGKVRGKLRAGQVSINGFVLSEQPLSLAELNELYRTCPVQLCLTATRATWSGVDAFDTRHLSE